VPRSKSLAFLIENPSNQNSSQLADNKQKRPVLIENFEPNRARVFAPLYPEAPRRGMLSRDACPRVLSRPNKASSPRVPGTEKRCAKEPSHEVSRSPYFLKTLSKKPTCLNHSFRAASPAREAAFLPGLPAVFSEGLPRAFFAKGSVCSNTFLPGFAQHVEIAVTYSKQSAGELLPGSRIARWFTLSRSRKGRSVEGRSHSCGQPSVLACNRKIVGVLPTVTFAAQLAAPVGESPEKFFAVPSTNRSRSALLTGSGSQTEIAVTHSKQSTDEFLTGSRIARRAFRTLQPVAHLRRSTLNICEGGRFAGTVSRNTGRGPRSTCLHALSLHLTNCRLNRLQLFRRAGVCTNRRLKQSTVCADKVFGGFICR
jgi:hypothetical protein